MGFIELDKIPRNVRGILYINRYDPVDETLTVRSWMLFDNPGATLHAYANTANPESECAFGDTYDEFLLALRLLHQKMTNKEYLKELKEYL